MRSGIKIMWCLVWVMCVQACASSGLGVNHTERTMTLAERADQAYTDEHWADTRALYEALIREEGGNVRSWYRLAVAQRYLGQFEQALSSLQQGVEAGLPAQYADYERAKVAATEGRAADAIALLNTAAAAGLAGKQRVLENTELAALAGAPGFDEMLDQLDANANPCRDRRYRQFDFWLGHWEVRNAAGVVQGRNRISSRESACLILEEWTGAAGSTGTSMNYFDDRTGLWHQVWVSAGLQLHITGGLEDNAMVMEGPAHFSQQNKTVNFRGTWTALDDGRVRQFFEQQDDDGQWTPWFEGFYTPIPDAAEGS